MAVKKKTYALGVDLGGTKVFVAIVDRDGKVLADGKKMTQADRGPEHVVTRIIKAMEEALANARLDKSAIGAIGLGAPGMVDDAAGLVVNATNLPGFKRMPLAAKLQAWLNVPVSMQNDVRAAATGEMLLGAGRGVNTFVTVFVGTGIGGGLVINGKLHAGSRNSAGEIGHMVMIPDGPYSASPTTVRGSIEALASRTAIERDLRASMAKGRHSLLPALIAQKGGELTSSVIAAALKGGDELTIEVLARAAHYLGLHASQLINALDPELLIYGGGLMEGVGSWMIPLIRRAAVENVVYRAGLEKVKFVKSPLGDNAGALGAAMSGMIKAKMV